MRAAAGLPDSGLISHRAGKIRASECGHRDLRPVQELLGPDEMPDHDEVAAVRDTHADPDAEFLVDFTGILDLIEAAASRGADSRPGSR